MEEQNSCLIGRMWIVCLRAAVKVKYDGKHESSHLGLDKTNERKSHGLYRQLNVEVYIFFW